MVSAERPGGASKRPFDSAWIDVSVPVRSGMVHWPDDPDVEIERLADMAEGYGWNLSQICMSTHTGTHVDAPLHIVADASPVDHVPLDAMIGPARVIEIANLHAIEPDDLRHEEIGKGDRILFKTINSQRARTSSRFLEDYVGVSPAAAELLVARGVQTVGIDYLSIGPYGPEGEATHRILLSAGIWVIECLDLSAVSAGKYEMVCLPLKLAGAEGAPARAILRKAAP